MKKLIVCQTPFQVIVSLYIKNQFASISDQVDIVITDTFRGYFDIYNKLKSMNIFDNVYVAEIKNIIVPKGVYGNILKLFNILIPKLMLKKVWTSYIEQYDEMYCWNYDAFTATIRSYFSLYKKPIKFYIYDEGYISYFPMNDINPIRGFMKIIDFRNKLFGCKNIVRNNIDGMLLFEPDCLLYKPSCPVFKIERECGMNDGFRDIVNSIFNSFGSAQKYDKKYIIFEENYSNLEDEKIFDKIVDIVGKENVIVKLHPRRTEDRFSCKGIKTLGNDGVPWEAIAFAGDFSDKVLISIGSGSITSYRMLFGNNMEAYMLFDFVKPDLPQFNPKYKHFWNKMESTDINRGIHMPDSEEEFYNILRRKDDKQ